MLNSDHERSFLALIHQDAAANSRLLSPTYARLMAGCSIKSMLYLTSFASLPELWSNPLVCLAYLPTASASLILNSGTLLHSMSQDSSSGSNSIGSNGEKQASPLVLRIGALFAPSSLLPKSPLTLTYTLLVLLYLATAAACWLPEVRWTDIFENKLLNNEHSELYDVFSLEWGIVNTSCKGCCLQNDSCFSSNCIGDR